MSFIQRSRAFVPFIAISGSLVLGACSSQSDRAPSNDPVSNPGLFSTDSTVDDGSPIKGTLASDATVEAATKSQDVGQPSVLATGVEVVQADTSTIAVGESTVVNTESGKPVAVTKLKTGDYITVEGVLTKAAFSKLLVRSSELNKKEQLKFLSRELTKLTKQLEKEVHTITFDQVPEVGYFQAMMPNTASALEALKSTHAIHSFSTEALSVDKDFQKHLKAYTAKNLGVEMKSMTAADRATTEGFSGLARMHTIDFVAKAEADLQALGSTEAIDGSSVLLGVTDTGITYNHPTFSNKEGTNRINYMKEFTGEGTVYFSPNASFIAKETENAEELELAGEFVITPRLPSMPLADVTKKLEGIKILVSPELKAQLLDPATVARIGIFNEKVFQNSDGSEAIDFNVNGAIDDLLLMIYIDGKDGGLASVYFDTEGGLDFTNIKPLHDWNASKEMVSVYAEKVGLSILPAKIMKSTGEPVTLMSAAIIGFDPGNHGSHVAGIAAGRKTISNDSDNTLARGVAPNAVIQMNRVCANAAGCSATKAIIDLALKANSQVINMSLGGLGVVNDGYGTQETVINRLTELTNTLFVISAGNSGPGKQTVGSPSTARHSLSVGASANRQMISRQYNWPGTGSTSKDVEDEDFMLFFSSRGPTAAGGFKPMISAPGTELSSVQLNSAPGMASGLDVYWGTSMAAPSATGAYALFVDAIQKYNAANPKYKLPTNSRTLRDVLVESARPFDLKGKNKDGQFTWIDEGMGLVDLTAAWDKIKSLAESTPDAAIKTSDGSSIDLDYEVIVPFTNPNGIPYDGSRQALEGIPAFGAGLYLTPSNLEQVREVFVQRKLTEADMNSPEVGSLARLLETSVDEFVLKTEFYGSNVEWLKAGTGYELDCLNSKTANLSLLGTGAYISVDKATGKGTVAANPAGKLYVCMDQDSIQNLAPGDHGAVISAYRKVGDVTSPVSSFKVPVYLNVPNQKLQNATGYVATNTVKSFGVQRHYVSVPKGTSVVTVTIEVPEVKKAANGAVSKDDSCSGVELMGYEGFNVAKSFESRAGARAQNCDKFGAPVTKDASRFVRIQRSNPNSGLWELNIFGQYAFQASKYKITVDYVTGNTSKESITGTIADLNSSLQWKLVDASVDVKPSDLKSTFELTGLKNTLKASVQNQQTVFVADAAGNTLRKYDPSFASVTLATGGADGNDLDIGAVECNDTSTDVNDTSCEIIDTSAGPTDVESVAFQPKAGKVYALRVDGYEVKNSGEFTTTEVLSAKAHDKGTVLVGEIASKVFEIGYSISEDVLKASALVNSTSFASGTHTVVGQLNIRTDDGSSLKVVGVEVTQ